MRPRHLGHRVAGAIVVLLAAIALTLFWLQFRGHFEAKAELYVLAGRAGLSMDRGSKVTFNGVPIGRLRAAEAITGDGDRPEARLVLDIDPSYLITLPRNVDVRLQATTAFGNKYVAFSSPPNVSPQRLKSGDVVDAVGVTTEFHTLFETVTAISEQVDPVRLNQTLSALAQAADGLGDRFGRSLVDGNDIMADFNARMPEFRHDIEAIADLADVYTKGSPDLWDGLAGAVRTAQTVNDQRRNLDRALLASLGFADIGAESFERGGPFLVRGAQDLRPTALLLDEYSPEFDCMMRGVVRAQPVLSKVLGGNGYSLEGPGTAVGGGNPYVYPENLPRINASGGPLGRPGCWTVTEDIRPMPYLVMDTGASIAPYNHLGLGSPFAIDYVWGRQVGENTINP